VLTNPVDIFHLTDFLLAQLTFIKPLTFNELLQNAAEKSEEYNNIKGIHKKKE